MSPNSSIGHVMPVRLTRWCAHWQADKLSWWQVTVKLRPGVSLRFWTGEQLGLTSRQRIGKALVPLGESGGWNSIGPRWVFLHSEATDNVFQLPKSWIASWQVKTSVKLVQPYWFSKTLIIIENLRKYY